jgi:tRNA A-37 threonylcarbamoyl transferase component Bud32
MHLFKKDTFSVKDPLFSKLGDPDKAGISAIVKKIYPDLLIKDAYQVGAFEINSNNWKIESDNGAFIFKRASLNKSQPLAAQARWTARLEESSFPTLKFLKNRQGQLISQDENFIYCLTYFEGGKYFGSSFEEWTELMAYQKKLYDYTLKDPSSGSSDIPVRTFFTSDEDQLITKLKSPIELKEISSMQLSLVTSEYDKMRKIFQENKKKYHTKVFHVDIHPHNLIFDSNRLILFTDFESFQMTTVEVSLGFGLYKCLRQLLSIEEHQEALKLTESLGFFKAEFQARFPEHNFKELISLAKIDILKRVLYILKELSETGQSKWLFILQTQLISLEEVNEIQRILSLSEKKK